MKLETIYQCDICGKQSTWNKDWHTHIFAARISDDLIFHVCSEYCDRILMSKSKSQKVKLYDSLK